MRIRLDTEVDPRDLPAVSLSLAHAAKKNLAEGYEPQNFVEGRLLELSDTLFGTYLDCLRSEFIAILERNND